MVLSLVQDLLDDNSLACIVVNVLLDHQPTTAKQIFFKVKKKYGVSISYQGLHKKLQFMEKCGLLKKDEREYVINGAWLDNLEVFTASLRDRLARRDNFLARLKHAAVPEGSKIKVVSFDLNGAIFTGEYDELLWRRELPRAYARQYGLSELEAFERVTTEFRKYWRKVRGWRDPNFWIARLKLDCSFDELSDPIEDHIQPYTDSLVVLKGLAKKYHLVLISHAHRCVIDKKLKRLGFDNLFLKIYSVSSDFGKLTKDREVFLNVCDELRIKPQELAHVGNDFDLDFKVPSELGVNAFFIDRLGRREEPFVVKDLYEFEQHISDL